MAHNTRTIAADAATGLRAAANREVAAARPTVAIRTYTPAEHAAMVADAITAYGAATLRIAELNKLKDPAMVKEALAALDMIPNETARGWARAGFEKDMAGVNGLLREQWAIVRKSAGIIERHI